MVKTLEPAASCVTGMRSSQTGEMAFEACGDLSMPERIMLSQGARIRSSDLLRPSQAFIREQRFANSAGSVHGNANSMKGKSRSWVGPTFEHATFCSRG